ncbi:MAG: hypothetical protein BWY75_03138 [bacterium ADurb.Bin425]|nr:MAG: hypothetical protein BWY75_03138 [bacterium ADurb.Bin425]
MTGASQVFGLRHFVDTNFDGCGTVEGADAGCDTKSSISVDSDGEGRALRFGVALNHEGQVEFFCSFRGNR